MRNFLKPAGSLGAGHRQGYARCASRLAPPLTAAITQAGAAVTSANALNHKAALYHVSKNCQAAGGRSSGLRWRTGKTCGRSLGWPSRRICDSQAAPQQILVCTLEGALKTPKSFHTIWRRPCFPIVGQASLPVIDARSATVSKLHSSPAMPMS